MRTACAVLLVFLAADQPVADLFAFFRPSVTVTAKDRERLESGDPVVSILDAEGHDLAVFSAIGLDASVTPARFVAWLHNVAEFRKNRYVIAVRRFSVPPAAADLEGLTLDDNDLDDIRDCRPGHCGLKLSSSEISALRSVVSAAGAAWKDAVQREFRAVLLRRVQAYDSGGHAALGAYRDRKRPRSPARAFSDLLNRTTFLASHAPHVAERLATAREPSGSADSFLYWSKERMGGKAVISATHVTIFRGDGHAVPEVLMTGKQVFATHYLDASLGVTALVRDPRTSRVYLTYVNRSDVDLLGGFWAGIARHMIEERLQADGPALLREAAARLSRGDPPTPGAGDQ